MKAIFKVEGTIELELEDKVHNQIASLTKDEKRKFLEKSLKHALEMCAFAGYQEMDYIVDLNKLNVVKNSEIEFKK